MNCLQGKSQAVIGVSLIENVLVQMAGCLGTHLMPSCAQMQDMELQELMYALLDLVLLLSHPSFL